MSVENGPAPPAHADQSVSDLVRQLSDQTTRLMRAEVELAKSELAQKGKQAGIGAGMFGGAGVFALYGGGRSSQRPSPASPPPSTPGSRP